MLTLITKPFMQFGDEEKDKKKSEMQINLK